MQVENYMARSLPEDPRSVGECLGCDNEILAGEEVYDTGDGLVHQDPECCRLLIAGISVCRMAGE